MGQVSGTRAGPDDDFATCGILRFADIEFDLAKAELRRAGKVLSISALSLSLLQHLVRNRERVVSRDELFSEVWRGVVVTEGSLRQAIWELRQVLDDSAEQQKLIRTVRGRGYRFVGALSVKAPQRSAAPAAQNVTASAAKTCFGRARELGRLGVMLDEAGRGAGRSCAIVGPPGVGKSRLARELVQVASSRQLACVEGYADPDGFAPAFWPWLQMLAHYFERADAKSLSRYRALSPVAFSRMQGTSDDAVKASKLLDASPAQDRFELLEEFGRLFAVLAADYPGILLLEDLQWADESSLALLGHVVRLLPRTRSLLVITCRDVPARENRPLARALEGVTRSALGERIQLGNLTLEDVASMIEAHTCGEVPRGVCADVHELSRGNPLFALELARLLARPGRDRDERVMDEKLEVQAVIARRLLSLPEPAQHALLAASVLSPEFELAELSGILQEPAQVTLARLDVCIAHDVMVDAGAGTRFRFAHPLMRESAYGSLRRAERARLHRLAGEWIERHGEHTGVTRLSELAHHFFVAAPNESARKAVQYALRCAEQSYASTAYADALSHYDRALSCVDLDASMGASEKLEIELLRGEALRASGADTTGVNQYFLALSERAKGLGDARLFARAVLGYTGQRGIRFTPTHFVMSCDRQELALLECALDQIGEEANELRVLLLCSLICTMIHSTDRQRRERLAEEALELARTLGSPWLLARALWTRIYCCAAPETHAARLRACDELVELTRRHGLKAQEADALVTRAVCLLSIGEATAAERDAQRAVKLAKELDLPQITTRCEVPSLLRAFWEADLEKAEQLTRRALAATSQDLVERGLFAVRMSALLMLKEGLRQEMIDAYENMQALYPDVIGLRCLLSSLYAQIGKLQIAERYFDIVAQDDFKALPEDLHWLAEMVQLACTAAYLGDPRRAALVYERLLPYGRIFDFFAGEGSPAGPVAYWLGELACTMGNYPAADAWYDVADELNRPLGAVLFMQYTALGRARVLFSSRPHELSRARSLLRGVVAFADRTGAAWLRTLAEEIERDFGATRHARPAQEPAARLQVLR
jgi:DNA-binding winged helix-turn-helix (wHTH) protein/tetratricopeptide (TPR) repeat protein